MQRLDTGSTMRSVAIVVTHFPPSNVASVHRARLLAQHLHEFGWKPIIVAAHHRHYEEELDWDLARLVDPALEVVHTRALPTRPLRIVGDIGLRSFYWTLAAVNGLRRQRRIDFVYITIPPFYSALLGELLYRKEPLPFGIDYIDPWVHMWPEAERRFSKAWAAQNLAKILEPYAVRNASLITGVAASYYAGVLDRHPELKETAITAGMPYGFTSTDFTAPALRSIRPKLFDPGDGNLHLVYAGALLPKGREVLARLLEGLALLKAREPALAGRYRLHFIGTGKSPNDRNGHNVMPVAARLGVGDLVDEHPHRMGYFDVLAHLVHAYGALIVGSTEAHYTPSKVYQSVQSRRPVLALLHEASTAVEVLERSRAGIAIRLSETRLPEAGEIADALVRFAALAYDADKVEWAAFGAYSARESARTLAQAMDAAIVQFGQRERSEPVWPSTS